MAWHRLFSAITQNWRGKPMVNHEVVVNLIGATTTTTGLKVKSELDNNQDRGPLLLMSGEKDTVPWSIVHASYELQKHNVGVTEIVQIPNRGHALTIDDRWREVAETALGFIQRFV
jgi:non-heme chloroperoxidase